MRTCDALSDRCWWRSVGRLISWAGAGARVAGIGPAPDGLGPLVDSPRCPSRGIMPSGGTALGGRPDAGKVAPGLVAAPGGGCRNRAACGSPRSPAGAAHGVDVVHLAHAHLAGWRTCRGPRRRVRSPPSRNSGPAPLRSASRASDRQRGRAASRRLGLRHPLVEALLVRLWKAKVMREKPDPL